MDDVVILDSKRCATYHTGNTGLKKQISYSYIHVMQLFVKRIEKETVTKGEKKNTKGFDFRHFWNVVLISEGMAT